MKIYIFFFHILSQYFWVDLDLLLKVQYVEHVTEPRMEQMGMKFIDCFDACDAFAVLVR